LERYHQGIIPNQVLSCRAYPVDIDPFDGLAETIITQYRIGKFLKCA
jgi:hypothetical protein